MTQPAFLGDGPPAMADRAARVTTILLVGKILTNTSDDLCRIRNISANGMQIDSFATLDVGKKVRIKLRSFQQVSGTVAWSTRPATGIHLDAPVDVAKLLSSIVPTGRHRRSPIARPPRLSTSCHVLVRRAGQMFEAELEDLSQSGAKLRPAQPLSPGDTIAVSIPGLDRRHGTVRWARAGKVGIAFIDVIAFAELAPWLENAARRYAIS